MAWLCSSESPSAWTFLYAGATQLIDPNFTVAAFLGSTKDVPFHLRVVRLARNRTLYEHPGAHGHLLIGLALVSGLAIGISSVLGILLMLTYYCAHMDFPYVESNLNFIMGLSLGLCGLACVFVIATRGGHILGLDGWLVKQQFVLKNPALKPLLG